MNEMFEEEPQPLNESDPEVQDELFESMKEMDVKPEDIVDADDSAAYETWLNK